MNRVGRKGGFGGGVLFIAGLGILCALILTALLAPLLAPRDPTMQNLAQGLSGPSLEHPLGQDKMGRDILSRLIYGSRVSLLVGLSTVAASLLIGTLAGVVSGYVGGMADEALTRIMDVVLAFPGILLALTLMAVLGPSLRNVVIALCAVGWVNYARLARGQVLALRECDFVTAARALGCGDLHIVVHHLIPNLIAPILVEASFGMGSAIVGEAGLSFLGLGVQPPTPSWGAMLNEGRSFLLIAPHLTAFPGLAVMTVVLGVNFFGDGLRDLLDTRLKSAPRPQPDFSKKNSAWKPYAESQPKG
jgi:peptide/nickel transport system permease protein